MKTVLVYMAPVIAGLIIGLLFGIQMILLDIKFLLMQ